MVAAAAGVSPRTFYATFDDKAAAFEAALLRCRLRMEAAALPAYRRSRDRPEGVVGLVRASPAFLDAEPNFTRLLAVDVYSAGRGSGRIRDRTSATSPPSRST